MTIDQIPNSGLDSVSTAAFSPCLRLPGGDGGGFHVRAGQTPQNCCVPLKIDERMLEQETQGTEFLVFRSLFSYSALAQFFKGWIMLP